MRNQVTRSRKFKVQLWTPRGLPDLWWSDWGSIRKLKRLHTGTEIFIIDLHNNNREMNDLTWSANFSLPHCYISLIFYNYTLCFQVLSYLPVQHFGSVYGIRTLTHSPNRVDDTLIGEKSDRQAQSTTHSCVPNVFFHSMCRRLWSVCRPNVTGRATFQSCFCVLVIPHKFLIFLFEFFPKIFSLCVIRLLEGFAPIH